VICEEADEATLLDAIDAALVGTGLVGHPPVETGPKDGGTVVGTWLRRSSRLYLSEL
jgi:hypothetical protein